MSPRRPYDVAAIRSLFPALARTLPDGRPLAFLDGPAGTQVPRAVIDSYRTFFVEANANSGGDFPTSRAQGEVEDAAHRAAEDLLNAPKDSVKFGANMTTLLFHIARAIGRQLEPGDEIIVTELDHHANVAPWQALADAVDDQRRRLLLAEELPRDLTMSGDLVSLDYPGSPVILLRTSAAARSALVSLGAASSTRAALVRLRLGDDASLRTFRQRATRFAGGADLPPDAATSADASNPTAIAASIARLLVALGPLVQDGTRLVVEVPEQFASLAGCLTAASMASGRAIQVRSRRMMT